jgi:hypothetical protein
MVWFGCRLPLAPAKIFRSINHNRYPKMGTFYKIGNFICCDSMIIIVLTMIMSLLMTFFGPSHLSRKLNYIELSRHKIVLSQEFFVTCWFQFLKINEPSAPGISSSIHFFGGGRGGVCKGMFPHNSFPGIFKMPKYQYPGRAGILTLYW